MSSVLANARRPISTKSETGLFYQWPAQLLEDIDRQRAGFAPRANALDTDGRNNSNLSSELAIERAVHHPVRTARLLKPKTTSGFVMFSEDEEDHDNPVAAANELNALLPLDLSGRNLSTSSDLSKEEQVSLPEALPVALHLFQSAPILSSSVLENDDATPAEAITCSGNFHIIQQRKQTTIVPFEELVAARSRTKGGQAKRAYYGIDIYQLIDDAFQQISKDESAKQQPCIAPLHTIEEQTKGRRRTLMWTEKYRARNFMELVGDDKTHRQVLRWLKAWDPIVFPKGGKEKSIKRRRNEAEDDKPHRKILLLTGPPGLGKTTLAHVCARQAGYEVMEINASDDRSSQVVKGRIRTSLGTESVKSGSTRTTKAGVTQNVVHPLCLVVDEVDGVVAGSGASGEGGFVKALIELYEVDQRNMFNVSSSATYGNRKKGNNFRIMRPLILICNDVYHASLRPLRQSKFAEVIHIRKPPLDAVATRMKCVFEKEGLSCENDAARCLCEAAWGLVGMGANKKSEGLAEGDIRSVMVVGEWAARKLKSSTPSGRPKLTRRWLEQNILTDLCQGGDRSRDLGRGGVKEVVSRIFVEGAGFLTTPSLVHCSSSTVYHPRVAELPTTLLHHSDYVRKSALSALTALVETTSETERIMTEIFSLYPSKAYNDDTSLSTPNSCYEWLHMHDSLSSKVFKDQDWELAPYLSQPVLACHLLFASRAENHFSTAYGSRVEEGEDAKEPLPFTSPRADFEAHEALKANRAMILDVQGHLNAVLLRSFRSPEEIAMELLPYVVRMLSPNVQPVVVGGTGEQKGVASVRRESERKVVGKAVDVMLGLGVEFEHGRVQVSDFESSASVQWVFRMEPPLDILTTFFTSPNTSSTTPTRYAIRQVLDQEYRKSRNRRDDAARQARFPKRDSPLGKGPSLSVPQFASLDGENILDLPKIANRDFFGRPVAIPISMSSPKDGTLQEMDGNTDTGRKRRKMGDGKEKAGPKVWVSYHEGFSNAVRRPLSVQELLRGM